MTQAVKLSGGARARLMRYGCGWCGQRLDRKSCGAIYDQCSEEDRQTRRESCLAKYRPRLPKVPSLASEGTDRP